ncbi:hypothetical protein JW872_02115 [Candidatus Babeliales bacterium]|nr:hypothetical protein [Candidatus Babeliales bacterium]
MRDDLGLRPVTERIAKWYYFNFGEFLTDSTGRKIAWSHTIANALTLQGKPAIVQKLFPTDKPHTLDLSNLHITSLEGLSALVSEEQTKTVLRLILNGNCLGIGNLANTLSTIKTTFPRLQSLWLEGNHIVLTGAQQERDQIQRIIFPQIDPNRSSSQKNVLKYVNRLSLDPYAIQSLIALKRLTKIRLRNNPLLPIIEEGGPFDLAAQRDKNATVRALENYCNSFQRRHPIEITTDPLPA